MPILLAAVVLLGGTLIALLQPPATNVYLDPASTGPLGARAIADILSERGHPVTTTTTPGAAVAAGRSGATVVVTSPELLTSRQLGVLATMPGDLVVVEPTPAALAALAPGVRLAGLVPLAAVPPRCALPAATLAGNATTGGRGLTANPRLPRLQRCYPIAGHPTLVQFAENSRLVTLLGSGLPLTNQYLARFGNAALALNLLESGAPRVVWLVPPPASVASAGPGTTRSSLTRLVPLGAWLVALQLGIALVLTALWRARRLGPLIVERLPVVVRASETVEGHGRLYRSRRARARAAAALRAAAVRRLGSAVGVPATAPPHALTTALSARCSLREPQLQTMLFGAAPADDGELVRLADDIDSLERQVLAQ